MKFLVLAVCLGFVALSKGEAPHGKATCAGEPFKPEFVYKISSDCHLKINAQIKGRVAGGKECPVTCMEIAMGLVTPDLKVVTDEHKVAEGLVKTGIYNQKQGNLIAKAYIAGGCHKTIEGEKACVDHIDLNHCFAEAVQKGCA